MKEFSSVEAIKFGWAIFKKNWKTLIIVSLSPVLISIISWSSKGKVGEPLNFIWSIIFWGLSVILGIGIIKVYLVLGSGKKPKLSELYSNYQFFLSYSVLGFFYGLIVVLGLVFLIVPGIIFAIRLGFWQYVLVDKNLKSGLESLKISWRITKGHTTQLFVFRIVQLLVNLLGILALGIGLLISGPVTTLASVFVYRKLSQKVS